MVQSILIKRWYKFFFSFLFKMIIITVICILFRLFVFEIYYIPSSSMESTLKKGDYILVSKLHYGPRLPRNIMEIPIINIFANSFISNKRKKELIQSEKPYHRINLFTNVKKDDVIVFNTPIYLSGFSVKRCSKVPSDTLSNFFNSKIRFSSKLFISSDSIGNIIIPWKGMQSFDNVILGKDYIDRGANDSLIKDHLFKFDYFYVLGDNANFSTDSRSWGLIQDDHVVGKALCILFSKDEEKDKVRWSRIFKSID